MLCVRSDNTIQLPGSDNFIMLAVTAKNETVYGSNFHTCTGSIPIQFSLSRINFNLKAVQTDNKLLTHYFVRYLCCKITVSGSSPSIL